jgi:localization factor PodJL
MPSPDRSKPWPAPGEGRATAEAADEATGAAYPQQPAEPDAQYFDPSEPWDAQSAEALTRLHESEDGGLWKRQDARHQQRAPLHTDPPAAQAAGWENTLLQPRITGLMQRLQDTLDALDPDKALAPLGQRLDSIEQRLADALSGVAQRSDVEGLRLIEAQVTELAAHVEQTGLRFDRLDAMDERMGEFARKFDEEGLQRLDTLERTLQSYVSEWRHSNERTSTTLGALDETLTRIGSSIDSVEAHTPAPDMSLAPFEMDQAANPRIGPDPLSQVYADGARALAPHTYASLDAADYTPGAPLHASRPAAEIEAMDGPLERQAPDSSAPPLFEREPDPDTQPAISDAAALPISDVATSQVPDEAAASDLAPPAFRASAMRAKLRQIQLADAERAEGARPPSLAISSAVSAPPKARNGARPSLLLAAGITLFAAAGYLLVDVFMTPHPQAPEQGQRPVELDSGKRAERPEAPETPSVPQQARRIDAFGAALATVFREAPPSATPALHKEASPQSDDSLQSLVTPPALGVGPASLRQAAVNGDPIAQYEVGTRYAAGLGVAQDLGQATQWFARAAARGLAAAQFRLAAMYERGHGTVADVEKARTWYLRAAQQGHVKAMHNLAVLSVSGGRSDYAGAAKWFAEAAARGLTDSQFNLAVLHQNGRGIARDPRLAYQWLSLAARGGDREAASRVAHVKSQLTAAEVQAADAAIAAWRVRAPDPAANDAAAASLGEQ